MFPTLINFNEIGSSVKKIRYSQNEAPNLFSRVETTEWNTISSQKGAFIITLALLWVVNWILFTKNYWLAVLLSWIWPSKSKSEQGEVWNVSGEIDLHGKLHFCLMETCAKTHASFWFSTQNSRGWKYFLEDEIYTYTI